MTHITLLNLPTESEEEFVNKIFDVQVTVRRDKFL